ncbi:hypothetical protein [Burkholderia territorii]|uniref:hypothetical protein n=1 Tax=Burkholderia territorii TaxID=1503055 RepID=UPI00075ABBE9|nr:hypothetical protein [Burkholderia territorii]KWE32560.1 hypothetical protein WT49_19290 [Burkholderia territorii]KWE46706.1 hypothetical protein WT50_00010 [Burkholderia territorii]KWE51138.1 hypothetical protein WT51_12275 [Burkholderia territorii]
MRGANCAVTGAKLECYLLWPVGERGVALSSLRVEDGDGYKAFLAAPAEAFCEPPASRASGNWRSFAPGGQQLVSQRSAVRALAPPSSGWCAGGNSVRGSRGLVRWAVAQLQEKLAELTEAECRPLTWLSPHAFRHACGTQLVATADRRHGAAARPCVTADHVGLRDGKQKRRRSEFAKGAERQLAVAREESRIGWTFALDLAHHGPLE